MISVCLKITSLDLLVWLPDLVRVWILEFGRGLDDKKEYGWIASDSADVRTAEPHALLICVDCELCL